jgi:SET family sugar efflux transporter-like MFS transporter
VAALLVARWLPEVEAPAAAREGETTPPPRAPWQIYPILAGFVLIQTSMVLGVQAMPLFISTELGGSVGDAGMILGVCAALEIPLMLGFGKLSTRMPLRRIILFGAVCGVAYQAVAASATSVGMLVAAQVLNAILIAAASGLGISYFQDLMPHFPGRASTMFANTFPLGQILSAPLFGLAQEFGFRLAYGLNLGLTALGLLLLLAVRPRTAEEEPALRHVADVARRTEG